MKYFIPVCLFIFLAYTTAYAQEKITIEQHKHGIIQSFFGPGDDEFVCYNRVHRNFFSGIFILVAALGVVIYGRYRIKRSMSEQLQAKNIIIEEKNKDITDSIQYAKRIQRVLMAPDAYLAKHVPDHFVLYKPKDIVSGDFYWATHADNKFYLCTADCTGHGVPGAFMSLLSISILNDVVVKKKIMRPDLILNQAREDIIKMLNPDGSKEEGKDGMDAVLCAFDFNNMKLQCAASNNPIWIIRKKEAEETGTLIEIKPDKFPVGMYMSEIKPFTNQEVTLEKGDTIYTFSDGFVDQLGGADGKKFKTNKFRQLMLSVYNQSMEDQKRTLDSTIEQWKGNLEQIDDILIVGVRI